MATLTGQQNQNYGSALARMAAQQAVDATLNHDLVSLQVILQDVVANPGAVFATIHDVENNLLVQAGDTHAGQVSDIPVEAHTTPITLHDSIAGYVTVTLRSANNHRSAVLATVAIITLLLAAIGGLAVHEQRKAIFRRRPRVPSTDDQDSDGDADGEVDDIDDDDATDADASEMLTTFARIRIFNRKALEQQLSAEMFETAITDLDHLVDDVLALYSGRRCRAQPPADDLEVSDSASPAQDEYLFQFDQTGHDAETPFRAVCCSYLLIRLAAQLRPVSLALGAEISIDAMSQADDDPLLSAELLIRRELVEQILLRNRLKLAEIPELPEHCLLQDFQNPFAALLEKQYQQLKQVWG